MAPLTDEEAQQRLDIMVAIMMNEAEIKVASLHRRERDLARQKAVYVRKGVEAIAAQYKKLEKKVEDDTKVYLLRQRNVERLKLLTSKDAMVAAIFSGVRRRVANLYWDDAALHRRVFRGLVLQGLLKILEHNVLVVVRPSDRKLAGDLMPKVTEDFHSTLLRRIPEDRCASFRARLAEPLETEHVLMEGDLGGVVLVAEGGAIVVDNTLRKRFQLLEEELVPQLKHVLFRSVLRLTVLPPSNPKFVDSKAYQVKPQASRTKFKYTYVSYPPQDADQD